MIPEHILQRLQSHTKLGEQISISPHSAGVVNKAYILAAEQASHRQILLKHFADDQFNRLDRARLFELQHTLASLGMASEPVWLSDCRQWHAEKWLDGIMLDDAGFDVREKLDIAAAVLVCLHSLDTSLLPECAQLDLPKDWQHYLEVAGNAAANGSFSARIQAASAVLAEFSHEQVLCHNDLAFEHIGFALDSGKTLLFDWEYAAFGSRYFDLASLAQVNQLSYADRDYFLQAYADQADLNEAEVCEGVTAFEPVVTLTSELWQLALKSATLMAN